LKEQRTLESERDAEQAVYQTACRLWEREGRLDGKADGPWPLLYRVGQARAQGDDALVDDVEKVMAARSNANIPALLTQDVPGG
jgi:hypothetical protein